MPAKKTKKRALHKKKSLFHHVKKIRGNIVFWLLIVVVIIGSIMLVGGILPPNTAVPGSGSFAQITPSVYPSHTDLQLGTLEFGACGKDAAIDFLIDNSGSMAFISKGAAFSKNKNLQDALDEFATNYPDGGIISMQKYSQKAINPYDPNTSFQNIWINAVPFGFFKDIKSSFLDQVRLLEPPDGGTPTRYAMEQTKTVIDDTLKNPAYKGKKIALVLISDGIPETGENNRSVDLSGGATNDGTCVIPPTSTAPLCTQAKDQYGQPAGCRCFDKDQDPTNTSASDHLGNIADAIKKEGVSVFTIVYVSDEEKIFQGALSKMMQNISSGTTAPYYNEAPIGDQIDKILGTITTSLCGS